MSHETSPSTHRPYGIARVTRVWQVPRSTVYAQRNRRARPTPVAKRGPKPPQSDTELTAAVRAVIAASPFHGEGHRKIWARLRVQGLRTSKRRTLVVMRAADLLGPARLPTPVAARPHDGTIVTASPNVMWGTDATATVTLADGHVTIFGAIDHCTAECVGLHAAKYGTRFEALEPVRQGVRDHFGTMAAGVASGLTMRHDHGSQYMSNDFHAELRFLGIVSSPAFVRQPEGNGCIERFFRTLKEQLLWVRHFTDVEDLQQALRTFKETYNQQWLIERLGFRAPRRRPSRVCAHHRRVNTLTRLSKKSVAVHIFQRLLIRPTRRADFVIAGGPASHRRRADSRCRPPADLPRSARSGHMAIFGPAAPASRAVTCASLVRWNLEVPPGRRESSVQAPSWGFALHCCAPAISDRS